MSSSGESKVEATQGRFQGFVARHYDLWFSESVNAAEQSYFKRLIVGSGEPAVEIGCGTGRLLLAWLQEGLDIDGVDYSEDMLHVCSSKAAELGLRPTLFHQAVQHLDLPRPYKTVLIPGNTFNLLISRSDSVQALQRLYAHLLDDGLLLLTLTVPAVYIRRDKPEQTWRMLAEAKRYDGAVIRLSELVELDYWEQIKTNVYKYEVYIDGALAETYEDTVRLRWFYQNEIELMLKAAGFRSVEFSYTVTSRGEDRSSMLVFAKK
jgi:SAM-dependent methyltransferase